MVSGDVFCHVHFSRNTKSIGIPITATTNVINDHVVITAFGNCLTIERSSTVRNIKTNVSISPGGEALKIAQCSIEVHPLGIKVHFDAVVSFENGPRNFHVDFFFGTSSGIKNKLMIDQ